MFYELKMAEHELCLIIKYLDIYMYIDEMKNIENRYDLYLWSGFILLITGIGLVAYGLYSFTNCPKVDKIYGAYNKIKDIKYIDNSDGSFSSEDDINKRDKCINTSKMYMYIGGGLIGVILCIFLYWYISVSREKSSLKSAMRVFLSKSRPVLSSDSSLDLSLDSSSSE